jgi:CHAT domain-containing protein
VSYTYSARYLLNEFNQNISSSSKNFFGIAPVQYSNGLPALIGSDESLYRMQHYFRNARTLVLSKASKNNFLNQFDSYRIIQLYAHATDSGYNGEPTIDFFDSTLSLSDLFYSKRPTTRLIVLSACETALGELHPGEGVFSFNRGFAALGIPSAVSNLWRVDNEATYKLTELFYKYVSDGIPLDVALQKAKKEFIRTSVSGESKLPYYWAASILVGKSDKIELQKGFPWKWVTSISVLLIFLLGGWMLKRKSNGSSKHKLPILAAKE